MRDKLCGMCFANYSNLKQHLTVSHKIPNREEFQLLMKYGNARTPEHLDCEICGKKALVRLDKHLQDSHNMGSAEEREPLMKEAKRAVIVRELAKLRDSDPDVPMVSTLDLGIIDEHDDNVSPFHEEEFKELCGKEQEEFEFQEEEEDGEPLYLELKISEDSSSSIAPPGGNDFMPRCSTPLPRRNHERNQFSSDPHQSTSQPLPSNPVSGSHNSSSTSPLPVSTNPPSYESELPSSDLLGHLSGQSEDLTGSISKASICSCRWQQFESRLRLLEQKVERMITAQPETPKSIPRKPPLSAQKFEHVGKGKKDGRLFEKILQDFRKFRLGPRMGKKARDNARQSSSHVHRFCLYMAAGLPSSSISHDIRFLNQMDKLRAFPTYLSQKGYAPTSMKNMLTNVIMFFKHVENAFQIESKLKRKELRNIHYELKRIQAEVQRKVVVHRQKVLRHKTDNQLDAVEARKFMMTARKRIPKLFEYLARNGPQQNEHSLVMGYIMGYLCNLTGHRSVVLTNMTKESVDNSESWDHGKRFQVLVDDHKTTRSFGHAALSLNAEEFGWLQHLSNDNCCIDGQGSNYVFHTALGKQIKKPSNFLHLAWVDSGMKGTINFNKIRSSVSTQANQHLSEKERKQVARSMCHDPSTAERFYVALPDKETSYKTRQLRMKALQMAVAKPSQEDENDDDGASLDETPETSSDSEEPIYDDQPQSSSSPSSEELRIMRKRRRFQPGGGVNSKYEVSSSPEDELPSATTSKSKRRLNFSHKSKQYEVPKKMLQISVTSPSKCSVVINRLRQPVVDYFLRKTCATKSLPRQSKSCEESPLDEPKNLQAPLAKQSVTCMAAPTAEEEPGCDPGPLTGMSTGSVQVSPSEQTPGCMLAPLIPIQQTPDSMQQAPVNQWTTKCIPETPAEQIAETPVEENLQCDHEALIQETSECVPETLAEQMAETSAEKNPGCVPEPLIQDTPKCVPGTPPEQMAETSAEENPQCNPEALIQETPKCVQGTPLEQMAENSAEKNQGCVSEPVIQETSECVQGTLPEQMAEIPAEEDLGCGPEHIIQYTPYCVPETPAEQIRQAPAEENPGCVSESHTPVDTIVSDKTQSVG